MYNLSFNVFITTVGRTSLCDMLLSLKGQLNSNDYITIVLDKKEAAGQVFDYLSKLKFNCTVTLIINNEPLGAWGQASRSKYQNKLPGDFILHADDDDIYTDDAFDKIRKYVKEPDKLYFFKLLYNGFEMWNEGTVKNGISLYHIDTANGVIPNIGILPEWTSRRGGDADFYVSLVKNNFPDYELVDEIIYLKSTSII